MTFLTWKSSQQTTTVLFINDSRISTQRYEIRINNRVPYLFGLYARCTTHKIYSAEAALQDIVGYSRAVRLAMSLKSPELLQWIMARQSTGMTFMNTPPTDQDSEGIA
jgi:hypothetical protein